MSQASAQSGICAECVATAAQKFAGFLPEG